MSSIDSVTKKAVVEAIIKAKNKSDEKAVNIIPEKEHKKEPIFTKEHSFVLEEGHKWYSDVFGEVPKAREDIPVRVFQPEDWDEEDRIYIQEVDKDFVPDHNVLYPLMLAKLNKLKVLIYGPTGSGKTALNRYVAAKIGQPYLRVNGREDMQTDSLLGKPWVSGGAMHWEDGEWPKAVRKGYYMAFDEPWKCPPGIQMSLQRFYERGGILQLDDKPGSLKDKQVYPDERNFVVLCDNVVGAGDNQDQFSATMIQDSSTLNRMDVVLYQGYMSQEKELEMLTKKYSVISNKYLQSIVKLANLVRTAYNQRTITATMSPRNLESLCELSIKIKSIKTSFEWTMLHRYPTDSEKGAVMNMYKTVFGE